MNNIVNFDKSEFAEIISEYWATYGEFRERSDFDNSLYSKIKKVSKKLLTIIAIREKILAEKEKDLDFDEEYILLSFSNIKVILFPFVNAGPSNKVLYENFYLRLKTDNAYIINIPYRPTKEDCQLISEIRKSGKHAVLMSPDDIDNLALGSWTLFNMLLYKFIKIYLLGGVDADAVFIEWQVEKFFKEYSSIRYSKNKWRINDAIISRREDTTEWVQHPKNDKIDEYLRNQPGLFVVGKSSAGKSILALDYGNRRSLRGDSVHYINMSSIYPHQIFRLGVTLYQMIIREMGNVIIIIDDLQCNIEISKNLLSFLRLMFMMNKNLSVISIFWPEYLNEFHNAWPEVNILRIEASDIQNKLFEKFGEGLSKNNQNKIREMSGDDLLILRLCLDQISSQGYVKDELNLASTVWDQKTQGLVDKIEDFSRAVMVVSFLGQYEIAVPKDYLRTNIGITNKTIDELSKAKIFVKRGDKVAIYHRSLARLFTLYLSYQPNNWDWFREKSSPTDFSKLLVDYLDFVDPSEIWSSLELIQKIEGKVTTTKVADEYLNFLIQSWRSINTLITKIYDQQEIDPSWHSTISSATFACEALGFIGKFEQAQGSINFIRSIYKVNNNILNINVTNLPTTKDFEQIRDRMKKEEEVQSFVTIYSLEKAKDINIDLMHTNWVSGLILCAEEAITVDSRDNLIELSQYVEKRIEKGGYFYPSRVPWVTARVLTGLGRCGRNIHNSEVVRSAVKWLMSTREEGGAREDIGWMPGTGPWNSKVETTAMCITALREVGVPTENVILREAMDWLWHQKKEWTDIGHELAGAIAIDAYLRMNESWKDIIDQIQWLSAWAVGQAVWMNATESSDKTMEQSCRVAQVAAFLISSMWSIIKNDLSGLIGALGILDKNALSAENTTVKLKEQKRETMLTNSIDFDVAISYAREDEAYVKKVAKCLEKKGVKVFYDKFEEVNLWGKDLYVYFEEVFRKKAKYCVIFLSEFYAKKHWTSHERHMAQARALFEDGEYILPIRLDDAEVPGITPLIGYIDGRKKTPKQICEMIINKIQDKPN